MENSYNEQIIPVRSQWRLVIWMLIASLGVFLFCIWIMIDALQFNSKYSLIAIVASLAGIIFGLYLFLHALPGFLKKGRVMFEIVTGSNGRIQSKKKCVLLKDIKDITIDRKGFTPRAIFFEDLIIYTQQDKVIKIPTYNMVNDVVVRKQINDYILPYMSENAQKSYKAKLNSLLGEEAKF
ncbi:hypothetical protein CEF21_20700 [Bacillus sp. FJAT-42376]|uniref:DUF5381 family protein n=1 Tax=Bacillus sp. FJAT-42376 TaxID=2014076 RepID=UPI000F502637|nr:DUF5381 family protein [Bacillus sp. FJAT-42376]AZB44514.1 hypothetical protein CEF21_20700 [Bacillus sp. FJAT-42376]